MRTTDAWESPVFMASETATLNDMDAYKRVTDDLEMRSRAYQVLYAMGDTPATVRTFMRGEAEELIEVCREVQMGVLATLRHVAIRDRVSEGLLEYVINGGLK